MLQHMANQINQDDNNNTGDEKHISRFYILLLETIILVSKIKADYITDEDCGNHNIHGLSVRQAKYVRDIIDFRFK